MYITRKKPIIYIYTSVCIQLLMADNLSSDSNPLIAAAQEKAISCPCPRLAENLS